MTTTLVTGATGTVGVHVVRELQRRQQRVRALTRDPDHAAAVLATALVDGGSVDLRQGDLDDPAGVEAAMAGVDRVVLCVGNNPRQQEQERGVIDAAARAGVRRLVKISARGARIGSPAELWEMHARIEQHLAASGVPAVVLRPSTYASNLLAAAAGVAGAGCLFAPAGSARISFVDPRDVAAVATETLVEDGHVGQTYILTGPEAVSYAEVAERLGAVLDRRIDYVDVPPETARAGMVEAGMPVWLADQILAVFAELRRGAAAVTTDDVARVLGRPPRPVQDFLGDHAAAFGSQPVPV